MRWECILLVNNATPKKGLDIFTIRLHIQRSALLDKLY
jgi:hypothetical protein